MKIIADLREVQKLLNDTEALLAGPVTFEISGTLDLTITANNGQTILDTTIDLDLPESSK